MCHQHNRSLVRYQSLGQGFYGARVQVGGDLVEYSAISQGRTFGSQQVGPVVHDDSQSQSDFLTTGQVGDRSVARNPPLKSHATKDSSSGHFRHIEEFNKMRQRCTVLSGQCVDSVLRVVADFKPGVRRYRSPRGFQASYQCLGQGRFALSVLP